MPVQVYEYLLKERSIIGKVKWFNNGKGFGFIGREDVRTFLVHIPQFKSRYRTLSEGDSVEFEIVEVPKAPKPPMSKENLSEHSCRKNKHSHCC